MSIDTIVLTNFTPFYRIHSSYEWRVNFATNTVCNFQHVDWRPNSTVVRTQLLAICTCKRVSMHQMSARCAWIGQCILETTVAIVFVAIGQWLNKMSAIRWTEEIHPYTMLRHVQSPKYIDPIPAKKSMLKNQFQSSELNVPVPIAAITLTSIIVVRLTCGLKKMAIVLCEITNSIALMKRMPCMGPMSLWSRSKLINDFVFFHNENATIKSSVKRRWLLLQFIQREFINSWRFTWFVDAKFYCSWDEYDAKNSGEDYTGKQK